MQAAVISNIAQLITGGGEFLRGNGVGQEIEFAYLVQDVNIPGRIFLRKQGKSGVHAAEYLEGHCNIRAEIICGKGQEGIPVKI